MNFDVVSFVPSSEKRVDELGYNHAQLIAQLIAKHLKLPCQVLLKKTAENAPQKSLAKSDRADNVNGVYECTKIFPY